MTLVLELTPEQEARLEEEARSEGMPVQDYALERLMGTRVPAPRPGSLAEAFAQWREEDSRMSDEEKEQADRDLEEFKTNMNAERAAGGERSLYR